MKLAIAPSVSFTSAHHDTVHFSLPSSNLSQWTPAGVREGIHKRHGRKHTYSYSSTERGNEANGRGNADGYGRTVDGRRLVFDKDLTAYCSWCWNGCTALDDVEGWRGRIAVDVGIASDVCAPGLAKGWAGGHGGSQLRNSSSGGLATDSCWWASGSVLM